MRRTAIDRSPKLKVGASVRVVMGYRAGTRGEVALLEQDSLQGSGLDRLWLVKFADGDEVPYPDDSLVVIPKLTSPPGRHFIRATKPINPVNRKRKDAQFEKAFGEGGRDGEWIRSQPCSVPGCKLLGPIQAHHAKTQNAGGNRHHLVPLCEFHHAAFHSAGRKSFDRYYKVDLLAIAAQLNRTRELEWDDPE